MEMGGSRNAIFIVFQNKRGSPLLKEFMLNYYYCFILFNRILYLICMKTRLKFAFNPLNTFLFMDKSRLFVDFAAWFGGIGTQ